MLLHQSPKCWMVCEHYCAPTSHWFWNHRMRSYLGTLWRPDTLSPWLSAYLWLERLELGAQAPVLRNVVFSLCSVYSVRKTPAAHLLCWLLYLFYIGNFYLSLNLLQSKGNLRIKGEKGAREGRLRLWCRKAGPWSWEVGRFLFRESSPLMVRLLDSGLALFYLPWATLGRLLVSWWVHLQCSAYQDTKKAQSSEETTWIMKTALWQAQRWFH